MSGIFGILNFGGGPVARADLEAMRQAMDFWGPHGSAIWQDEDIGLGHLLLHNTPESLYDSQPLHHSPSGVILTAHARIDNREELIAELQPVPSEVKEKTRQSPDNAEIASSQAALFAMTSDSELILHAYLRWDEDCVYHLLGDWAFAIWDPRQRKLFLARDHFGISSLYYYQGAGFLAFASSVKGLLALSQIPQRPNLLRVAQVLTSWPGNGVQTAYKGILQLPNAHTLRIKAGQIETQCYWNPADIPPLHLPSDDEYVEAFLEIYTAAVSCRLRCSSSLEKEVGSDGGVGATLSSGLDSGSICALAARELRKSNKRLHAYTSIPIYPTEGLVGKNRYGDEAPLVEINRTFIPNLDVEYIRAENFSPLAGIARALELHDSPIHSAGNKFWIYEILETARRQGLEVVLIGQAGNGSISWASSPENFWPLLLAGRWVELRSKILCNTSLYRTIRSNFLRPLVQPFRNQAIRLTQTGRYPWADYAAIHPDFVHSINLKGQMQAAGYGPFFMHPVDPRQAQLHLFHITSSSSVSTLWAENCAAYGLEARDPTMDKRLTEFCLAIPQEQYRLNGQDRALIRRAMVGLLPDAVRLNTRRGRQAADLGHRLLAELPQVQTILAKLEASELARTVLDLPKMQSVLNALQVEVNQETTEQSVTILTRGLMVGLFLLRFA